MNREAPVFIVLATAVVIGLIAAGQDAGDPSKGKPDITGRWKLDVSKSRFGAGNAPLGMSLHASKQGTALHFLQTTYGGSGTPETTEIDCFPDGKVRPSGSDGTTSISRWEGNTLLSETKSKDGSFDDALRFNVSPDGRIARETVTLRSPRSNISSTLVWEKN